MLESLLQTKLYVPQLRPNLVPRPHLIKRLNRGLQQGQRLTLVSAPAGFGKTTLVGEWADYLRPRADRESQLVDSVAWLSLDEGDNDPTRFLSYLVAALQSLDLHEAGQMTSKIGEGAASMLQSSQSPPIEAILISLINDVAVVPDRIVLVLDDYHLLDSLPVDGVIEFVLEHLPPRMHVVIITRNDPGLPLARLRAKGQLAEMRAADLRFSTSEAAVFLNQAMGLSLSPAEISALEDRTEGWIVGLQLAALSMQGKEDTNTLINSFTGNHRFVLDYLLEEVLDQLSDNLRIFLLKTSILSQLSGALCDALTGQDNGQALLEMFDSANMFIIPLDEKRQWYRYHHLFGDLLQQRLRQMQPDWVAALHIQASQWYRQNGLLDQAIEHALSAGDFERAAHLIDEHFDALWLRGVHANLRRWLIELPIELLFSIPQLCIFHGLYMFTSGQQGAAERSLQVAEQLLEPSREPTAGTSQPDQANELSASERLSLRGRLAAIRAFIGSYSQVDVEAIIRHAHQALEFLPEQDLTMRSLAAIALGDAYANAGDMKAAYLAQRQALAASEAAGNTYFRIVANGKMAMNLREQGQLGQTLEICQQQVQLAGNSGLSQGVVAGWLLAVWGEVLAELDDLDGALARVRKGVEQVERGDDMAILGWCYLCLMRVLFSKHDATGAAAIIDRTEKLSLESDVPPWLTKQMAVWQVRHWLAQGKLEAVSEWVSQRGLDPVGERKLTDVDYSWLIEHLALARYLIAQGRLADTAVLLQRLLESAEAGGRTTRMIEILSLQALAFQEQGDIAQAMTRLERALSLAEAEGFVRIFVDEGPPMARLLLIALDRGISPVYVHRLLGAFTAEAPTQADASPSHTTQSDIDESLSERELDVLELIAEGLTNKAIASRLFLSQNTVKVHARNINGKLGVHSRTQAVAQARALGILPVR